MKKNKLYLILLGLILIIVSGCNLNDTSMVSNEGMVEFGTTLPSEFENLEEIENSATKAGYDWAGWYSACLSWTGVYKIYVYPYYNSTERYGVMNYMCDNNYKVIYWVKCYGFGSPVPYENFYFNYSWAGKTNQLKYYTSGVKKVRHTFWEGSSSYMVNYSKQ